MARGEPGSARRGGHRRRRRARPDRAARRRRVGKRRVRARQPRRPALAHRADPHAAPAQAAPRRDRDRRRRRQGDDPRHRARGCPRFRACRLRPERGLCRVPARVRQRAGAERERGAQRQADRAALFAARHRRLELRRAPRAAHGRGRAPRREGADDRPRRARGRLAALPPGRALLHVRRCGAQRAPVRPDADRDRVLARPQRPRCCCRCSTTRVRSAT